ncbi:BtpA/SgcQ family protein [soil metagenome]
MHRADMPGIFGTAKPVIGMVHLPPLPGAPLHRDMAEVIECACRDAVALAAGGVDALLIENYGDAPFFPDTVPPETVAALACAATEVRRLVSLPLGVNVLRNDARAALAIAAVTGAAFIRVNVHTGAMLTDQGWIAGRAHETMRARALLNVRVAVFADVLVKHAVAPVGLGIASAARDTWERGHADALIISGAATGSETAPEQLEEARTAVPAAPLLIGSGLTAANAVALMSLADGAIVGSAFQRDGRAGNAVEQARVEAIMHAVRRLRS